MATKVNFYACTANFCCDILPSSVMFRGQGAVLKHLFTYPRLPIRICISRCQSTKSAIHAALKKSDNSEGRNRAWRLLKAEHEADSDSVSKWKALRFRRSLYDGQEDHDFRQAEEREASLTRRGERHPGSSLRSFLPDGGTLQTVEHRATNRRTFQDKSPIGPRRSTEVDRPRTWNYDNSKANRQQDSDPLVLPYTTPASEFLYGYSVVTAALRARRRKFYKMYIYESQGRKNERDMQMRGMAADVGVPVEKIRAERYRMLDKMSEGRPHNVTSQSLRL